MKILFKNIQFLAIALHTLRISPLLLVLIITITTLYVAASSLDAVYIQSIGSGIGTNSELAFFGGLIVSSQIPKVKLQRLTLEEQSKFILSDNLKDITVGLLLGDLFIQKQRVNARLCFKQGVIHKDYLEHLYELFSSYCSNSPKITNPAPDKRTGKTYNSVYFHTYSLPCFNELQNLFYLEGKKIVPSNIKDLLTIMGLCYWICDDGGFCKRDRALILNTQGFSLQEVELLLEVLTEKFNLKCKINKNTIKNDGRGFVIRISTKSVPHIQSLLKDIMPPMMKHKIGL